MQSVKATAQLAHTDKTAPSAATARTMPIVILRLGNASASPVGKASNVSDHVKFTLMARDAQRLAIVSITVAAIPQAANAIARQVGRAMLVRRNAMSGSSVKTVRSSAFASVRRHSLASPTPANADVEQNMAELKPSNTLA